jgi:O-antigen ligase
MSVAAATRTLSPCPAAAPVRARPAAVAPPGYALGFFLFVLVNAVLFVRPTEYVPGLVGLELYLICTVVCLLASFPAVLFQLVPRELEHRPMTVCVLVVALAVAATAALHADKVDFWETNLEYVKVVTYYLLFVGLVTTPERLRRLLFWLPIFGAVVALVTLLQYYGLIQLPNVSALREGVRVSRFSDEGIAVRLRGTGVFRDPNDLCVLLAFCTLLCLYRLSDPRAGLLRLAWLAPLAVLGLGMIKTQSRGGFLALVAGLLILFRSRYGWFRTLLLGAAVLPVLFLLAGERQARLSAEEDTSQTRVQLWADGLYMLKQSPLFGVGKDRFNDEAGQVAHNSFVHAFAELGPLGGVAFLGAFYLAFQALWRCGSRREKLGPDLARMQPFLTGAVASYIVGMMTLSLTYVVPTYTVLALAASFERLAVARGALPPTRADHWLAGRLLGVGIAFLVLVYVFVRLVMLRG